MKKIHPKIHDINKGQLWSNAHAACGRAMEKTNPSSRMLIAWFDEETHEVVYLQTAPDVDIHYMCHKIAESL